MFAFVVCVSLLTFFVVRNDMIKRNQKLPLNSKKGHVYRMKLTSSAFENNGTVPAMYTCTGKGINPPLTIGDVPQAAKSLVLIVDDPDAPGGIWVHWVVYNISPSVEQISENSVPKDGIVGNSSFGKDEYGGPCPPPGMPHHYHFKLYALDATLLFDRPDQVNKELVEEQMKDHIIDQAELIGLYSR